MAVKVAVMVVAMVAKVMSAIEMMNATRMMTTMKMLTTAKVMTPTKMMATAVTATHVTVAPMTAMASARVCGHGNTRHADRQGNG